MTAKKAATSAKHKTATKKHAASAKHTETKAQLAHLHVLHVEHEAHLAHLKATGKSVTVKAKPAKPAKATKKVAFAVGDWLPVCGFEAVAQSLRLAGQPVHGDDVAGLWELCGSPEATTIEDALAAAVWFGLAGCRPSSLGGLTALDVGSDPFERLDRSAVLSVDADTEPHQQRGRRFEPFGGADAAGVPAPVLAALGDFIARHEVDDFGLQLAAASPWRSFGVADFDAHAIGHEVDGRLCDRGQVGKQEQLGHGSSTPVATGEFNHTSDSLTGGQLWTLVDDGPGRSRTVPDGHVTSRQSEADRYSLVTSPGVSLILRIDVPGPHAVLATRDGWWSWGELYSPWPARVSEAWAVSWS